MPTFCPLTKVAPGRVGLTIGLAVWQEVNIHQMPLQRENPLLASSVSACPLGQLKLLSGCGLWQPQQVIEPSPASRAHWATGLSGKRKKVGGQPLAKG